MLHMVFRIMYDVQKIVYSVLILCGSVLHCDSGL